MTEYNQQEIELQAANVDISTTLHDLRQDDLSKTHVGLNTCLPNARSLALKRA